MKRIKNYSYYDRPQFTHLCELIGAKAESQPGDTAFAWFEKNEEKRITYKQFAEDVCRTSAMLKMQNDGLVHIGLLGENCYAWLVLFAAVIDSGNVVVALDKDMPAEELAEVSERLDVAVIYADAKHKGAVRNDSAGITVFPMEIPQIGAVPEPPLSFRTPDTTSPACIFLTSGTSGKRKGVVLSHENLAADINNTCKLVDVPDTSLAVLPFHHAFGLTASIWMLFNHGHPIYISRGLRYLQQEMVAVKPQTMLLVPLFVENFYKQIRMKTGTSGHALLFGFLRLASSVLYRCGLDCRRKIFGKVLVAFGGKLETIICGGAALDPFYVRQFRQFGIEILNGYGTTECSPVAAVNRNLYHKDGTVGLPIPESHIIVKDGEVLVSGKHVMLGYYGEPEATTEVLRDGFYCTGDLGYLDEDGFLILTGRKKNLIILSSGENVSPEELEEKLLRIDGVEEAVVSEMDKKLAATIYAGSSDEKKRQRISEAIEQINKTLPMYKRICAHHFTDEPFKKTTTMKIIRS